MNKEFSIDMEGLSVAVAIPAYRGIIPIDLNNALIETFGGLIKRNIPSCLITERECAIVSIARNRLVDRFLETGMQKLFFIDDDIIFEKEDFERLLCWSTLYPIVCGTYPIRSYPPTFYINFDKKNPTLNEHGLLKISGAGLGFTIIDRSVFEKMPYKLYQEKGKQMKGFFDLQFIDGKFYGEDNLFMKTWEEVGGEIWLDPMVTVKHFGNHVYEANFGEYLTKLLEEAS